jgi:hypothetical protein
MTDPREMREALDQPPLKCLRVTFDVYVRAMTADEIGDEQENADGLGMSVQDVREAGLSPDQISDAGLEIEPRELADILEQGFYDEGLFGGTNVYAKIGDAVLVAAEWKDAAALSQPAPAPSGEKKEESR